MKRLRFSEEQLIRVLKEADASAKSLTWIIGKEFWKR